MKEKIKICKDKLSLILLIIGVLLLILKGILPENIDPDGILNEHFYLLPIGYGFIFLSIITYIFKFLSKKIKREK